MRQQAHKEEADLDRHHWVGPEWRWLIATLLVQPQRPFLQERHLD
jgi:hypothetical protein